MLIVFIFGIYTATWHSSCDGFGNSLPPCTQRMYAYAFLFATKVPRLRDVFCLVLADELW